ncbi:hypothetical protein P280DRAFT_479463 [Massarina eburnea CBS 473.64]|uniref:Uncharacterized protein n=1 Tax=Massarina eburnea CBS 473.64 TaxID=1395130 RepID=A0A6A6S2X0_9PLEO|nr:hypothetical protein P280DRAFT_479463 [Massarina eburnea CBS 473.64]
MIGLGLGLDFDFDFDTIASHVDQDMFQTEPSFEPLIHPTMMAYTACDNTFEVPNGTEDVKPVIERLDMANNDYMEESGKAISCAECNTRINGHMLADIESEALPAFKPASLRPNYKSNYEEYESECLDDWNWWMKENETFNTWNNTDGFDRSEFINVELFE